MKTSHCFCLTIFLAALFHAECALAASAPLFEADEVLRVRLEGPLSTLIKERSEEEELPARMTVPAADGSESIVDVAIRARGNFRRRRSTCPFPPIRLNFPTKQVEGTMFEDQDKLKLVTHCHSRRAHYEQHVLREYLAYRLLGTLTDESFRVRLLEITYVDTESNDDTLTKMGFVIEDDDDVSRRIGKDALSVDKLSYDDLDREFTNLVMMYEFMIGNTDFSLIRGPAGDDCCHNSVPMTSGGPAHSVPYDFDMAGIVDAPYATPDPRMKLRSVKDRLYRGRCSNNELLPATLDRFRAARDSMFEIVAGVPTLDTRHREQVERYLGQFFEIIDDPDQVDRRFVRKCS